MALLLNNFKSQSAFRMSSSLELIKREVHRVIYIETVDVFPYVAQTYSKANAHFFHLLCNLYCQNFCCHCPKTVQKFFGYRFRDRGNKEANIRNSSEKGWLPNTAASKRFSSPQNPFCAFILLTVLEIPAFVVSLRLILLH